MAPGDAWDPSVPLWMRQQGPSQDEVAQAEFEAAMGGPGAPSTFDERIATSPEATPEVRAALAERIANDRLAERQAAIEAAAQPEIAEADPVAAGLTARGYGRPKSYRDQLFDVLSETVPVPSRPNPQAPIAQEMGQAFLGTEEDPGLLAQEEAYTAQLGQAQIDQAGIYAEHYEAEAARLQAQADQAEQRMAVQEMRRQEMVEIERKTVAKIAELSERLNAAPDIDPERYWNNQSAGRKFAWALSAMFMGFAGLNAFGALNSAIERDIDAQKANFEQRKAGFASQLDVLGAQRNLYQDVRTAIDDEMVAADAVRLLRLQQAESALMKRLTANGVPMAAAQANLGLNQIQQAKAEKVAAIKSRIAAIPTRIGGGRRPAVEGDLRKMLVGEFNRAGELEGDIALEGFKQEGAVRKEQASGQIKAEEQLAKDAQEMGKRTSKWRNVLGSIDDALAVAERTGNEPWALTEERAAFEEAVGRANLHAGTAETGASVAPDQTDQIRGMLGGNRWTGSRRIESLKRARAAVAKIITTEEEAFAEPVRQFWYRNKGVTPIEPKFMSEGMPSSARRR